MYECYCASPPRPPSFYLATEGHPVSAHPYFCLFSHGFWANYSQFSVFSARKRATMGWTATALG